MPANQPPRPRELSAGLEHHRNGRWVEAEASYREALVREPTNAEALHLLGMVRVELGSSQEGLDLIRRSLEIQPNQPHVLSNYGSILAKAGRPNEAIEPLTAALRLAPQFAEGHNNLGAALERLGRWDEALVAFERAIALKPDYVEAHTHRGNVLRWFGHVDAAIEAYRTALRLRPNHALAHSGLGAAYGEVGDVDGITRCQRAVLDLWPAPHPSAARAHSDLLYTLHYDPELSPEQLFIEHQRWAELHAAPVYPDPPSGRAFTNDPAPERSLRIGYVSADFRNHPVATFLWGALEHADHRQYEIHCYSDVRRPDEITRRYRDAADHWRNTASLSDEQLAELVRQDRIDILVDQAGHAGGNRMLLFARRAAPVQVTFNGYVDTTALRTMDYRLTDAYHALAETGQQLAPEQFKNLLESLKVIEDVRLARRRFAVQAVVSAVILLAALALLAWGMPTAEREKALFGLIWTVIGYWLR